MAATLANGDYVQVRVVGELVEQVSINVMHFRINGVVGTPDTQQLADLLDTDLNALFKPLMANDATYRGVGVRKIKTVPLPIESVQNANAGAGTGGATALAPQTAGLISLRTANAGPAGRGRLYLPFPPAAADTGDGVPSGAYKTAAGTLAAYLDLPINFGAGGNTGVAYLVVYHRGTLLGTDVDNLLVSSYWATQRRRSNFGRPNTPPF